MVDTSPFTVVNNLVYNVAMPINTKTTKIVQTVLTLEEYNRILLAVESKKKSGHKITVSKYVRNKLLECWQTEDFLSSCNKQEPA